MSDVKKPSGVQIDAIDRNLDYVNESFDLDRIDNFVTNLGVEFLHYKAMPSPIGLTGKGELRRNDGVDTITSNGQLYICSGRFTATFTDNSKQRTQAEAGLLDPSEARLVLPRFYNDQGLADGKRIHLAPGDRIYVADPNTDVLVSNYQRMEYEDGVDNVAMFPIVSMELPLIDSRNIHYTQNVDYCITSDGDIRWIPGGKNPGIDPKTGKGRVYSIRYLYRAYYYITTLLKEVRITNVTTDGVRKPERMPMHCIIQREFMFHNQNRGDKANQLKSKEPKRVVDDPIESAVQYDGIIVDMSAIGEDEQS